MATHRFALSAGHRNNARGGAWKGPESAWTYPMTQKLRDEIVRRGGEAFIVHEHDGDHDPSFTFRGLGETAQLAANIGVQRGGIDAYLSMHYGAEPVDGFFAIFPDATGLRPAGNFGTGHHLDVRGNNTLDIRLARVIAKHVAKTGMPIRGDGTLSETRSGVGYQGWRLGELEGTVGIRTTTPRLILEAGNSLSPKEYELIWSPAWQDKYAKAIVDGLEEVFGKFGGKTTKPAPKPIPEDPNEGMPRTFTVRFDIYARSSPGFWDYDKNEDNRLRPFGKPLILKPGTTGTIIEGPKVVEGVPWYDLKIDGVEGVDTAWVQDQVLHTLEIKNA